MGREGRPCLQQWWKRGRGKAEKKETNKACLTKPPTPKSLSPLEQEIEWLDRAALLCPSPILGLEGFLGLTDFFFFKKSPTYRERGSVFLKQSEDSVATDLKENERGRKACGRRERKRAYRRVSVCVCPRQLRRQPTRNKKTKGSVTRERQRNKWEQT